MAKILLKNNSWIRIRIRISTEIEWFVASETSHSSKKFHENFDNFLSYQQNMLNSPIHKV